MTYPVTALTICAIATTGLFVKLSRPMLPPEPENSLASEASPFLRQGGNQQIQWKTLSAESLSEAKRRGKPILLVMGTAWSSLGRHTDGDALADPDVEAFLSRYMTCLRVDLCTDPQWQSAFFPLSRTRRAFDPDFQIVFLEPDARPFRDMGSLGYGPPMNAIELLATLQSALSDWESSEPSRSMPISQSEQENALLSSARTSFPDFSLQRTACIEFLDKKWNTYVFRGTTRPNPHALRSLWLFNETDAFARATDSLASSNLVDWIDGGFFTQIETAGRQTTSFDKSAVLDAETMELFAEAYVLRGQKRDREIAAQTFWYLANIASSSGLSAGGRAGTESHAMRSRRSSITVRELRDTLGFTQDLDFARYRMGLRVETNPMMTVRVQDAAVFDKESEQFERVLEKLRRARPAPPPQLGRDFAHVGGTVVAKMLRTALLMGDQTMKTRALELFVRAEAFRASDDVVHQLGSSEPVDSNLGDYLGISDMYLQNYLATGDVESLQVGLKVLLRARFLFATETPGVYRVGINSARALGVQIEDLPELLDPGRESRTAQMIRLFTAYARLLRDPKGSKRVALAQQLAQDAETAARQFSEESLTLAFSASAYFNSCLMLASDVYAITVGEKALELAHETTRELPALLCAPASATVCPSLLQEKPGVYLLQGTRTHGPFTAQEAAERARSRFQSP